MRHILLYITGFLFFHTMPPLVAARPALTALAFSPHLLMYATAALVALIALRSAWVMRFETLMFTLAVVSGGALLIIRDDPATLIAGFLALGATVPILLRHAFEDAIHRGRPIGSMLGFASFALEAMAFSMGALATYVSAKWAQSLLVLVPLATLIWIARSRVALPQPQTAPRLNIFATIQDVIPAVAANSAFFLFLSGISLVGDEISPMRIGSAIAITAIGFSSGAFLSDRIRKVFPDKLLLVIFSLCGLAGGVLGSIISLSDFPGLIFVIALCIACSNGVIISISLSSRRLRHEQAVGLPADNALVFLCASGVVALGFTLAAGKLGPSSVWLPIILVYLVAIVAALLHRGSDAFHARLGRQK